MTFKPRIPSTTQFVRVTPKQFPSTTPFVRLPPKNIQPQYSNRFKEEEKWTSLPVIDPPARKEPEPQKINTWFGIENILRRNSSDLHKIDEIIDRVNKTGSLSRVNVFNQTSRINKDDFMPMHQNVTYLNPYEDADPDKDSKELKVQFVLDCDLKDGGGASSVKKLKTKLRPKPTKSNVKKNPNHYQNHYPVQYSAEQSVFNMRIPMTTTTTTTQRAPAKIVYPHADPMFDFPIMFSSKFATTTTRKPIRATKKPVRTIRTTRTYFTTPNTYIAKPTTKKPKVKHVYVDPPVVAEMSNAFESMYGFFEDALTTKVKTGPQIQRKGANIGKKKKKKRGKKRRLTRRRSTVNNAITPPSFSQYSPSTTAAPVYVQSMAPIYASGPSISPMLGPMYGPTLSPIYAPTMSPTLIHYAQPWDNNFRYTQGYPTMAPNYQYTQGYGGQNAQKLTTNIQVTSQYVGKEPATAPPPNEDDDSSEYSDEIYSDYSDEDDDDREGEDESGEGSDESSEEDDDDYGLSLGLVSA